MLLISATILEAFSLNLHQKYPYHTSLPHCVKIVFLRILWPIYRCARCGHTGHLILLSVVSSSQGANRASGRRRSTCSNHTYERSFPHLHVSYCIPKPCTLPLHVSTCIKHATMNHFSYHPKKA